MNSFKIPKIRFMNFNNNWKYIMLGEISNSIEYGLNAAAKDFDGIHKYLRITDIDDSSRLFLTDKLSSPDVNFTEEDYKNYKLQKNDLLFARTGASVGKTYLYRESDGEVYYAGFLIRARLRDSFDGNFVFQQTLTDKYKQFIEITSQRSGQPGVNGKEYGEWKIGMTSYHEQSAIGSLFRTLDDLLVSYKDNLTNYQSLKATMLSKMFPKAGQTVPEIRLDGFEGEWKSDTFESYLTESRILGDSGLDAKKITVKLWGKGVVEKEEKYAGSSNTQYYIRKAGQFIYSKLDFQNQAFGIVPTELDGYQSTLDLPTFDVKGIDTKFLLEYVMRREFYEYQGLIANGSRKAKRIHPDDFLSMPVRIPSLAEQQAIGVYFSNLDQLITSYQGKITQLDTLKKKLLQDMFI
ncbi:restriction endonuclease subunit S [Streptococcus salivarius]|uniref:restriction endonuclease subunit S n=2 Tax=Streptococcus salivarius TaxID=1304 RepID=UPI001CF0C2AE|nr:restriction endonuclease subunit S [Streptococcus salivarius]MCA6657060.1 restriction endonuclease subunit S [Streptococcus salivarius]MCA6658658.1 restriction endonuclease subunit S [Streptococcus salivarius]